MAGKNHAIHNEKACDFLLSSGEFNDWVITTAFYSALHYVCNELFPLEHQNITFENFERYYRENFNNTGKTQSKHSVIISLVSAALPSCNMFYRSLYDQCMTARYSNYVVSDKLALKAKRDLDNLKLHLRKIK